MDIHFHFADAITLLTEISSGLSSNILRKKEGLLTNYIFCSEILDNSSSLTILLY